MLTTLPVRFLHANDLDSFSTASALNSSVVAKLRLPRSLLADRYVEIEKEHLDWLLTV